MTSKASPVTCVEENTDAPSSSDEDEDEVEEEEDDDDDEEQEEEEGTTKMIGLFARSKSTW